MINNGKSFFAVILSMSLFFFIHAPISSADIPTAIEYKQTMVKVLQESDVLGWPTGNETATRYPESVTVSEDGSKVGFVVKLGSFSNRHIYVMNANGSGLVDLTDNAPSGAGLGTLQLNDDGSRLFFWDYGAGNIYYFDTSSPYACHPAYKPDAFWLGSKRSYGLNSDGSVIYLKHFWQEGITSHYGLVYTVVGSNVLNPVVDVLNLTPAKTADYDLQFVDAARSGGRLIFTYYPDYWHDAREVLWESSPLQPVPNEWHNMIWDHSATSLQYCHIMSADGSKALYDFYNTGSKPELHLLDLNSGAKTLLMQHVDGNDFLNFPALSPDGTIARWSSGGYNSTRMVLATGDLRDTFSYYFPESGVGNSNLTDITSDNRYYFLGSEPAGTSYIHRVDMAPVSTAPAPDVTSITFGQPQFIFGDTTPVTITVHVSDPKGADNIQSVNMHTLVDGREFPSGQLYEPLFYWNPLSGGNGVYTITVFPRTDCSVYTNTTLPKRIGVRIVVRSKDEHYTVADTSIMVHPSSDANPVQFLSVNYASINDAYDTMTDNGIIKAREFGFVENLILNKNFQVILKGGYDTDYNLNIGCSSIWGYVVIGKGSLVAENIIIK